MNIECNLFYKNKLSQIKYFILETIFFFAIDERKKRFQSWNINKNYRKSQKLECLKNKEVEFKYLALVKN